MSEFFSYDLEGLEENGVELKFKCVRMQKMLDGNIKNIRVYNADFTEHDKPFEKRIKLLQEENRKLYNQLMETEKDYQAEVERLQRIINHELGDWDKSGISYQEILDMKAENESLKQRIAELESKKRKRPCFVSYVGVEEINGKEYVSMEKFATAMEELNAYFDKFFDS